MIFAESGTETLAWIGSGVLAATGLISAIAAGVVLVMNARNKGKLEESKAKLDERDATIRQWREYGEYMGRQIDKLSGEAARARAAELGCQEDLTEQRATILILYDFCSRLHAVAVSKGWSVEAMPPRPGPRPNRAAVLEAAFVDATLQHDTAVLKQEAADRELPPPSPPATPEVKP